MSCSKKVTCSRCKGEGKVTVYESEGEHKLNLCFNGFKEYQRPSWRETCPTCNGQKKIYGRHDFNLNEPVTVMRKTGGFFSPTYPIHVYTCNNCGKKVEKGCDAYIYDLNDL